MIPLLYGYLVVREPSAEGWATRFPFLNVTHPLIVRCDAIVQGLVLLIFIALGIGAAIKFRPEIAARA